MTDKTMMAAVRLAAVRAFDADPSLLLRARLVLATQQADEDEGDDDDGDRALDEAKASIAAMSDMTVADIASRCVAWLPGQTVEEWLDASRGGRG